MTEADRLLRIVQAVRVLLAPTPLGRGPIRMERWNEADWTDEQRGAYEVLRAEAGLREGEVK
jgi:hypothetical protein